MYNFFGLCHNNLSLQHINLHDNEFNFVTIFFLYRSTIHLYQYLTILIENWILSNEIKSYYIINNLKQLKACSLNPVYVIINLVAIKFILTKSYLESDDFGNFPHFNKKADGHADFDHEVCLVIKNVQDNDEGLEDVEEDRSHGQTLQGFTVLPELYV